VPIVVIASGEEQWTCLANPPVMLHVFQRVRLAIVPVSRKAPHRSSQNQRFPVAVLFVQSSVRPRPRKGKGVSAGYLKWVFVRPWVFRNWVRPA